MTWRTIVNRRLVLSALLLGLASCAQILDIPETVECGSDDACTSNDNPCVLGECVDGTCAFTLVAEGEVVGELDDGDCKHLVCDGAGNTVPAADPADAPVDATAGDCVAPACSETGEVVDAPAEDAPTDDIAGDCVTPACDAGAVSTAPDPNDAPGDTVTGDCSSPTCTDAGVVDAPNDDDLPTDEVPGDCSSPTCQDGAVVVEPNPADLPPDIAGDCLAAECGAQGLVIDDLDVPTTGCGGCSNGVVVPWTEGGMACYTGLPSELSAPNTACVGGTWACVDNEKVCEGEQLPVQESCGPSTSGVDDDCNGQTDEDGPGCACQLGMTQTCYEGPPGTGGVGTCTTGTSSCMATMMGNQYGPCVGDTFPETCDSCLDNLDEDCSGSAATCTGSHVFSKGITNVTGFTAKSTIVLPNGEILVAGDFSGSLTAPNTITSDGGTDIALIRFDADGNAINAREFGGTSGDSVAELVLLDDGYALVGTLGNGSAETFGAGSTLTSVEDDGFVVKFTLNHAIAWKKLLGGNDRDRTEVAARMPDNGLVVAGVFEGTINLGGNNLTEAGYQDIFVVRLASDGTHTWSFKTSGPQANDPEIVAGIHANAGGRIALVSGQILALEYRVRTYDPNGTALWTRSWDGGNPIMGVALADDDTTWVGGVFQSGVNVDNVAGIDFVPTGSGQDLLFVRYDASGALLGGQSFNGTTSAEVSSMRLSEDGGILAAGSYRGTLFFGAFAAPAVGSDDAFLVKLNPSTGAALWSRKPGGTQSDSFHGIATAGCGDVSAVGSYRSSNSDFGGGSLPFSGSSSSIDNGVLAKYRP
jgi:hypothetical protein